MIRRRALGFTLIEAIIAMVITGIVGVTAAMFLKTPVQAYMDSARRSELTDVADTVLRRVVRDLRLALPNSVRVQSIGSTYYLEFLLSSGGGRYRAKRTSAGTGNPLDFDTTDTSFDVIGTPPACGAGQSVVVFNLGPAVSGANAYAGDNRAACTGVAGSTVTLASPFPGLFESPGHRFQVVDTPVSYECSPSTGVIRRYTGYAIAAAQPAPPAGGQNALIAQDVSACSFSYAPLTLAERAGIVTISMAITQDNESVRIAHQTHVTNIP
ncbi:MAG: type II secretion system protein J [Burkholderiales bacterium]